MFENCENVKLYLNPFAPGLTAIAEYIKNNSLNKLTRISQLLGQVPVMDLEKSNTRQKMEEIKSVDAPAYLCVLTILVRIYLPNF